MSMKTHKSTGSTASKAPAKRRARFTADKRGYDKELISTILEVFAEYEIERILELVVQRIPKLVGAKEASLFWYDREANRIVLRQTSGVNKLHIGKYAYALGEGLTGWVAKSGLPLRIENIEDANELRKVDPALSWSDKYKGFEYATSSEREHRRSFLAVPIKIEGTTMGVLRLAKTVDPQAWFTEDQQYLLTTFADHLSTILKKAELLQKAKDFNDTLIDDEDLTLFNNTEGYLRWVVNFIPAILSSS
jgi:signal transduction protein with GAF and PtsI domain